MDKDTLLRWFRDARLQVEKGDVDIAAQHEIVKALERRGLDATSAEKILTELVSTRDLNTAQMDRLLDQMDDPDKTVIKELDWILEQLKKIENE